MTRVLALCSAADPSGAVKQFDLALPLLRGRFDVILHTRPVDVNKLLHTTKPDLIHTLGADAFRAVKNASVSAFSRGRRLPPWVAAGAAAVDPMLGFVPGLTATISQSEHERDWSARLTPAPMLFSAPVAVAPPLPLRERGLGGEGHGATIIACGGFDAVANLKHVVWAFDALRYAHPQLRLVLLGDGPQRADIERFARTLSAEDLRVECVGHHADISPFLAGAVQAWGTHSRGGTKFLLEAMAAGVAVIAARTRDAERVIRDGADGLLVPVGQPVEMVRSGARVAHFAGPGEAARHRG